MTQGKINRDETITFGGEPGKTYDVTVRIRGIVEPKHYLGGTKDVQHEGWYVGGTPSTQGNYNVYMLGVSNPQQVYYLNALDQNEAHFTYPIDYTVTIPIAGGAAVRFLASDSNCSAIRNCDPTSIDNATPSSSRCNAMVLPDLAASDVAQPFEGQFMVMHVVSVAESAGGTGGAGGTPGTTVITPGPLATAIGATVALHARVVAADGSLMDATGAPTWSSSDEAVASVGTDGKVTGVGGGVTTIRATVGSAIAETTLQVIGPPLSAIAFLPSPVKLAPGTKLLLLGQGSYSDGRTFTLVDQLRWATSNPSAVALTRASVVPGFVVTGGAAGATSVVSATAGAVQAAASVTVKSAALQSIDVSVSPATVACGGSVQLTAAGHYADGDTLDVTSGASWTGSGLTFQTYDFPPVYATETCPAGVGMHTVSASLGGVVGQTTLTVTGP